MTSPEYQNQTILTYPKYRNQTILTTLEYQNQTILTYLEYQNQTILTSPEHKKQNHLDISQVSKPYHIDIFQESKHTNYSSREYRNSPKNPVNLWEKNLETTLKSKRQKTVQSNVHEALPIVQTNTFSPGLIHSVMLTLSRHTGPR